MKTPVKYALVLALIALAVMPLAAAVDVTITVVDKDDNPIEDAEVLVKNLANATEVPCNGTTDGDGQLECDDALESDADYKITVTHDDYQQITDDSTLKEFDNDWKDVGVVMRPNTYDLTVTVCSGGSGSSCGSADTEVEDAEVTVESLDEEMVASDYDYDRIVFPKEKTKYEAFEVDSDDATQTTENDGTAVIANLEFNTNYNITVEKSGYPTTWVEYEYPNKAQDEDVDVKLVEPGKARFTAVVYNQVTNELIAGATVEAVSKVTNKKQTETTSSRGEATFEVATPACYTITATKDNFGSDSTEECFENDDVVNALPLFLVSENRPPNADAGPDQYVLAGASVTLDASGSADPDDDELTYEWTDSGGIPIPSVEKPTATFNVAGEHVITLTVSDGLVESTDTVTIYVDKRENCGDNFCSLAENATRTCPQDCPVCLDEIKGAGECVANASLYCPVDCGIKAAAKPLNTTPIVPGNTTTIEIYDPVSKAPIVGASLTVTLPNGTVLAPRTLMGKADVAFPVAGKYTLNVTAPKYVGSSTVIEVKGGSDLGWLLWPAVIIIAAFVAIRAFNYIRKSGGGLGGGGGGYRAKNFKRGKPTLSRL